MTAIGTASFPPSSRSTRWRGWSWSASTRPISTAKSISPARRRSCPKAPPKESRLNTEVDEAVPEELAEAEAAPGPTDEEELHEAVQTEVSLLAEAARFATPERVRAVLEALLFAAEKPLD